VAVDRFLTFIRVFLVTMIVVGVLAFIWQQIDADNVFARWRNPNARGLTGDQFKGLLISGLSQGSMYGLIALGYSMVYGVLGFINFAHGEVFMVGAMTGFIASDKFQANGMWEENFVLCLALIVLMAIFFSTFTAVVMERVAYRPLRNSPRLIPLTTSIGVSFFVQNPPPTPPPHQNRGGNQPWRVAERPVGHPFHHHGGEGREEDGHQDNEQQAQQEVFFPHPVGLELVRRDEAGHSPHHEDLAVGEVDEPQHAVDHRVAEGDQAVHGTLGESGDQEALELVAGETPGVRVPPAGEGVLGVDLLPDEGQYPDHDHRD